MVGVLVVIALTILLSILGPLFFWQAPVEGPY